MIAWMMLAAALFVQATAPRDTSLDRSLFDGRRLAGWVEMGKAGAFVAENGILHLKAPQNHPSWLRTDREYENFVLRLEYMVTGWCESGILLHAPLYGDLARTGLKLHLRHDRSPGGVRAAGALYDLVPPLAQANKGPHKWNALEIQMNWPSLRITLNGVLIQDVRLDRSEALRSRARRGYIGLEDLGFEMKYRNIAIRELPDTDRPWRPLFNRVDLEAWVPDGEARWVVEDGKIVGSDGDGSLLTKEELSAFEFQTYFRTSRHANGGIFYRRNASSNGEEIQIYNVPGSTHPTGSIYGQVPAREVSCRDGEWCQLRMISDGPYTAVWVNGRKVAESWSMASADKGRLGFQNHSDGRIEYLEPKVRPLSATRAP
ncbi:MAG: DUF1080 domain-containing protein [Luteitalea sp.]|nr:DUF1080 domain-containing protein [Luteitalea sp.]